MSLGELMTKYPGQITPDPNNLQVSWPDYANQPIGIQIYQILTTGILVR
jgi:hypothetical protein